MVRARLFGTRIRIGVVCALGATVLSVASAPAHPGDDLTRYVEPRSGTLGAGFPMVGATVPFGMIQPGPDTGLVGSDNPFTYDGYMYEDPMIHGLSLTHFDGAGIHISGDLPFMPTTGAITTTDHNQFASPYDHATEIATPGYYAVNLARYQVRSEMTATMHAALMRLTFPASTQSNVLLAASESLYGSHFAHVDVSGDHSLTGWILSDSSPSCAGERRCYKLYFDAEFSRPFAATGTWDGSKIAPGMHNVESSKAGAFVSFDTTSNQTVQMRVGISYVDAAGASNNLQQEIPPAASFDSIRTAAHDAWNARLHDIEVSGGDQDVRTFYSNLYRALTMPTTFDDADGRYLGLDDVVRTMASSHHHYMNLSLWDTFRTQHPLLELIEPDVERDVMISILDDYDQANQVLPRWVQANRDYGIMGGDSATPFLADGIVRGLLKGADAQRAYAAMLHAATTSSGREHLDSYLSYHYVPQDVSGKAANLTQQYAVDDAALMQVAKIYGTQQNIATLSERAGWWRNIMYPGRFAADPQGRFIRPRNADGTWADPPNSETGTPQPWTPEMQNGYQEGTGWQYLWAEPHDVAGLASAEGGSDQMLFRLDRFFSSELADVPVVGPAFQEYSSAFGAYYAGNQYTPANEPDLWAPWYYDWLGQPWKTQKIVRAEMQVYNSRPDGLPGNDDAGEMSSWYVFAALGLYPVTAGVPVMEINSPTFRKAVIHVGSHRLTISAPDASIAAKYVQSASLDGASVDRTYLTQCEMLTAHELRYSLDAIPNLSWGTAPDSTPPSVSDAASGLRVGACAASLQA